MSNINKAAVLNPLPTIVDNIVDYIPRASTSKFGVVAIGSGINIDSFGRIYLDTQEYSDRLTAIEAQAASNLATQKSEVAAAIAQVNLAQSQTITALTLEVSNLKTNLTDSITATQTDLINRADQLAQDVTDITDQLALDKAAFTQEIQDALVYLENAESVASALRTPRKINGTDFDGRSDITTNAWGATRTFKIGNKANSINGTSNVDYSLADIGAFPEVGGTIQGNVEITGDLAVGGTISATLEGKAASADKFHIARKIQGVDFDGTQDVSLPTFTTQTDGLVPKRVGATTTKYLREDGTWVVPPDTTYALLTAANAEAGTATSASTISAKVLKDAIKFHAPTATDITGNAGTATKLQTPRTINGVLFDGTQNISLPEAAPYSLPTASNSVLGGIKVGSGLAIANSVLSVGTLNQSTTGNAATATKLQTARTISLTGNVTGSASFDGSANASITTAITGLGVANGIATLDSSGQVPSTQLPSYVDDVLEYLNVAAFPTTGVAGKIYVETTGNTTYRWGGTAYVKITSGEVSSVAGKTGVVTLTKADVGLANADNTADSAKSVASASKLTAARTIGGISFDGSANIALPGVNIPGNQSTAGNAATATKLATVRTINGVSFDGTSNITIAAETPSIATITSDATLAAITTPGLYSVAGYSIAGLYDYGLLRVWSYGGVWNQMFISHISNSNGSVAIRQSWNGTAAYNAWRVIDSPNVGGNAATATKLQTARTINDVSFDGSANITITDNGKLPLTGGTITGSLNVSDTITITNVGDHAGAFKKLIQADTTTDGGYIAVGNNAADKGYVEIGTVDDADAEIYASQRALNGNTVIRRAKLLDAGGNTSFPGTVTAPTFSGVLNGNAATATQLATARTINDVAFNGTANITIADSTKVPLTGGTMTGILNANALGVNNTSGATGLGLSLYGGANGGMPDYGLAFSGTATFGTHGSVVGEWATYFTMSGATNRGWIFKSGNGAGGNVASISANGEITGNRFTLNEAFGANYIANGNGDAASYSSYNMVIRSHWGIGFRDYQDVCRTVLDTRTGNFSTQGTIAAASVVASGNITAFSDARLKDNITKIPDALNKLNRLKGVTFTRKDLASDKQYAGLIAQDVQKVLPEAVATTEGDIIAVDYNGVIGLLVEAIKELNNRIDKLERI